MVAAKIVEECYLVTWMDKVHKMLSEKFLGGETDELVDVLAGEDHLPSRPDHKAEAVETGERVETCKDVVALPLSSISLQLWVW